MGWPPGIFSSIFINSQEHRIHHATETKYYDTNFGMIKIQDKLFGTYVPYTEKEVGTKVGVDDPAYTSRSALKEIFSIKPVL